MYVKIEQKLSKGFNSWKTMMLANGDKIKKYGMTIAFAGAEKEDDISPEPPPVKSSKA